MSFEQAANLSEILHYTVVLGGCLLYLIGSYKDFVNSIIKIYLIFITWGILCFIFQGCPITLFENFISESIYGKPFYPDYTFTGSDFYFLITNKMFYVPLVLGAVATYITKRYKNAF